MAYLGKLDEAGRLGIKHAADDKPISPQKTFVLEPEPEWVEVDAQAVRVENCRQFGGPWLAMELIKTLGLDKFLGETIPSGREDVPGSVMALLLVITRLCDPSSELSIAENFSRKTALSDLLGVPEEKVYDNRLYRALDKLLPHKAELEVFLKEKLGDLFELEYGLLLYDVTSTYFEGEANRGSDRGGRDARSARGRPSDRGDDARRGGPDRGDRGVRSAGDHSRGPRDGGRGRPSGGDDNVDKTSTRA